MQKLPYKTEGYFGVIQYTLDGVKGTRLVGKYAEQLSYATFKTCQKATRDIAANLEKKEHKIERTFVIQGSPVIEWDVATEVNV